MYFLFFLFLQGKVFSSNSTFFIDQNNALIASKRGATLRTKREYKRKEKRKTGEKKRKNKEEGGDITETQ